jgi:hypothetical protein
VASPPLTSVEVHASVRGGGVAENCCAITRMTTCSQGVADASDARACLQRAAPNLRDRVSHSDALGPAVGRAKHLCVVKVRHAVDGPDHPVSARMGGS